MEFFYPGSLLETGHDILFFWVARMVMLGFELLDKLPFTEVYLHAMIRDKYGRKMSKSLGNVIDPLDVINGIQLEDLHKQLYDGNLEAKEIERAKAGQKLDFPQGIPECGTDALRFALCSYTSQGRDINLDVLRVQGYRFFCNKLWNASKFSLSNFGEAYKPEATMKTLGGESKLDLWILSRLTHAVELCDRAFTTYDFPTATTACYNFWLYELCDIYLECIKPVLHASNESPSKAIACNVLYTCLDVALRLIHPFMPFISEELYQRLPRRTDREPPSICVTPYPETAEFPWRDEILEQDVEFSMSIIRAVRSMRADYQLTKTKTELYVKCADEDSASSLKNFTDVIQTLASASNVHMLTTELPPIGCAIQTISAKCEVHLLLKGLIDVKKEVSKLDEKKVKLEAQLNKLKDAAAQLDYISKVPENIRRLNAEKVEEIQTEISKLSEGIERLARIE
jgi:valyl-tRNA synthetase